MREVQASEAKIHLPRLLSEVERGETIVITRHGRPIARIVPETDERRERIARVFEEIDEFRKTMPSLTRDEILSARHEGHKY
ncbi:antitoxin [Mesorhizobium sp. L-8-10]|uniref:type II toxin-antitoxin system Phd/YefM family antitoxin n=1 Tax=unclassified Mesorhizobium TaxID=325217 RepID=UPI0019261A46|nr:MULTISPECIES: type II toxin-antitoxin system prevent-host-death family antitoxin [unclassified Mesorhizobium]BCH22757.1 antitoxin [Mesorhizobium sp. L-8-3]BCH30561.1 antitoxin [Mesorhizobium sp. L-8-10]